VPGDAGRGDWRKIAAIVLKRSLGLHRGQSVIIETESQTLPTAEVLVVEARRLGIRPLILYNPEWSFFESQKVTNPSDANALSHAELAAAAACDGYIRLPTSCEQLLRREALPRAQRTAIEQWRLDWNRMLVRHSVPSVNLIAAAATPEEARHFDVDLEAWRRESYRASVVSPSALRRTGKSLGRQLQLGRRITITHPNGTHLELGLAGRRPFIDDGMVDAQDLANGWTGTVVPGGYLVLAIDERVAEGRFVSNLPTHHLGNVIEGITWTFRKGRLARYEITTGKAYFESTYRAAVRGRDRPAVLYVGLNPEIHSFPHTEDQALGTVSVEIGHNEDFGGRTRGTFRQFALLRGADLLIDDRVVLHDGQLR
jgi:leucyl aminopeptidase (aminopeptidase T)